MPQLIGVSVGGVFLDIRTKEKLTAVDVNASNVLFKDDQGNEKRIPVPDVLKNFQIVHGN